MKRPFRQIALYSLLILLSCMYGLACAGVTNHASTSFDNGRGGNAASRSNLVAAT